MRTGTAGAVVLDSSVPDERVRAVAIAPIARRELEAARQQIAGLVRPPEDLYYQELQTPYRRVRGFVPTLLRSVHFGANRAGEPVLQMLALRWATYHGTFDQVF